MFVAVTLGATLIHKDNLDRVHAFLSPICYHFLHVFFLCCAFAVPGAQPHLLAGAAILSALWRLTMRMPKTFAVVHAEAKQEHTEVDLADWMIIVFLPIIVYVVLIM
jgi:Ni,Fe-hydrogenase I cytochrome b subunit